MNAKEEFLGHIEDREVRCAIIRKEVFTGTSYEFIVKGKLRPNYTQKEYESFLKDIDFEYDSGYGCQELDGVIWYKDLNTWSERGEYDGSEWWEYKSCPDSNTYFK
jgi:hypothetical protein